MSRKQPDHESVVEKDLKTIEKPKLKRPDRHEVLLHNDDYTTQEFVVHVLVRFFHHGSARAQEIMMHVHSRGIGVAGTYTYDVAETKATQTVRYARENEMPLQCSIRRLDG